jgi:lipoprotein-releasing system permease protein
MNIVLYLSSKYLTPKASDRGISAIAVIALLTIIVSSAAAVVILSAANGIHSNFLQKLMAKDAHIIVLGPGKGIPDYKNYISKIEKIPGVKTVMPYFQNQALIKGSLNVRGTEIMGVPSRVVEEDKDFLKQFVMQEGKFDLSSPNSVILGYNLAWNLGASIGSFVYVTVYSEEFYSVQYKFKVRGIFSVGNRDYDSSLAFISFQDAQLIFDSAGMAYGLAIKVEEPFEAEKYIPSIKKACPYYPYTWKTLHRNDYAALQDEKMLIMVILAFFFIVVGFNILSTMIAMVLDKKEEIGILKAMGLKPKETLYIFLLDGFLLGVFGSLSGILTGLFIAITLNDILRWIEKGITFINSSAYFFVSWIKGVSAPEPFHFFNSSVYYIDKMPMQIIFTDLAFVLLLSVFLSSLAVVIPAFKASRLRPVEVLRND